jgi:hypothetical protein
MFSSPSSKVARLLSVAGAGCAPVWHVLRGGDASRTSARPARGKAAAARPARREGAAPPARSAAADPHTGWRTRTVRYERPAASAPATRASTTATATSSTCPTTSMSGLLVMARLVRRAASNLSDGTKGPRGRPQARDDQQCHHDGDADTTGDAAKCRAQRSMLAASSSCLTSLGSEMRTSGKAKR